MQLNDIHVKVQHYMVFSKVLSSVLVPVKMHSGNSNAGPATSHNDVQIRSNNQSENFQLFWTDRIKF